ncbi:MAG: DUF6316 family protein [Marinobacter sp.]|uniref:DUF6316 family protein n=1 Tax=Marinobacter sp. TaxID=50741 RepID=UPI00299E993A|nr:DUF6316 family protein [Marinobacter sp.]MDX1757402.1 DUF6316 family protein [Marinobacter sp.]
MQQLVSAPETTEQNDRFVETAAGWYVLVRENSDLGPFTTRHEAEQALQRHLRMYRGLNPRTEGAYHGISIHDSATCQKANCGRCIEARQLDHCFLQAV